MDNLYELGLNKRKSTLGDEYVEKTIDNVDELNS